MSMSTHCNDDAQTGDDASFERFVRSELARYDSRIEDLEAELEEKNETISRLRDRVNEIDARTDMLRLVEDSDQLDGQQRSAALLQHMQKEARNKSDKDRTAIDRDAADRILHYPDVDRTTIISDMKRCQRMVGDKEICWYEGRDDGNTRSARLVLDLTAGELPADLSTKSNGGA